LELPERHELGRKDQDRRSHECGGGKRTYHSCTDLIGSKETRRTHRTIRMGAALPAAASELGPPCILGHVIPHALRHGGILWKIDLVEVVFVVW
jgi:hypothetical protein